LLVVLMQVMAAFWLMRWDWEKHVRYSRSFILVVNYRVP